MAYFTCFCCLVAQSCLTLFDHVDYSPPGSSARFPRQEYWSGLPFPSPVDLPDSGMELTSPVLQADSLPLSHLRSLFHLTQVNPCCCIVTGFPSFLRLHSILLYVYSTFWLPSHPLMGIYVALTSWLLLTMLPWVCR